MKEIMEKFFKNIIAAFDELDYCEDSKNAQNDDDLSNVIDIPGRYWSNDVTDTELGGLITFWREYMAPLDGNAVRPGGRFDHEELFEGIIQKYRLFYKSLFSGIIDQKTQVFIEPSYDDNTRVMVLKDAFGHNPTLLFTDSFKSWKFSWENVAKLEEYVAYVARGVNNRIAAEKIRDSVTDLTEAIKHLAKAEAVKEK